MVLKPTKPFKSMRDNLRTMLFYMVLKHFDSQLKIYIYLRTMLFYMVLKPQQYSSFRLVTQYDGVDPSVSGISLTISLPNQRFLYLSITISKILLYLFLSTMLFYMIPKPCQLFGYTLLSYHLRTMSFYIAPKQRLQINSIKHYLRTMSSYIAPKLSTKLNKYKTYLRTMSSYIAPKRKDIIVFLFDNLRTMSSYIAPKPQQHSSFRLVTQYDGVDPSVSECPLTISLPNQRFFILHTFNFYSVSFSFIYYLFFQLIISPFPITFIWFRNTNYLCLIANSCLNNFC